MTTAHPNVVYKLKNAGADVALLELPFTDHAFDAILPKDSLVTKKAMDSVLEWLSHLPRKS